MGVPIPEQKQQFIDLDAFLTTNRIKTGDQYLVVVINVKAMYGWIWMAS
jgi:hypothetical protein